MVPFSWGLLICLTGTCLVRFGFFRWMDGWMDGLQCRFSEVFWGGRLFVEGGGCGWVGG